MKTMSTGVELFRRRGCIVGFLFRVIPGEKTIESEMPLL